MLKELDSILRCPTCKGILAAQAGGLFCAECGCVYSPEKDLMNLLPADLSDLKKQEHEHYTDKIDYYIEMHKTWCESPFYRHYHEAFLDDIRGLPENSLVLELGCGLGNDGLELLQAGYRLVETDIAPGELMEACRMHERQGFGEKAAHILSDAENLPFKDDSFDSVFMVASLHHLPDPEKALVEARRVLKPGGIFVMGTEPHTWQHKTIFPVGNFFLKLAYRILGKENKAAENVSEADQETEGFSGKELEDMFRRAGFSGWKLKPAGYVTAAIFFQTTEFSNIIGRNIRLFALERLFIPFDEMLGRMGFFRKYPWHWNAIAYN